jgi:hypothetical protein
MREKIANAEGQRCGEQWGSAKAQPFDGRP